MDATATEQAVLVSLSKGAQFLLEMARLAPARVAGAVFVGPMFPYTPSQYSILLNPRVVKSVFGRRVPAYRWWLRMNAVHWRENYSDFADWFISRCFPEPHSTKGVEDGVEWALDTDPETLIATALGAVHRDRRTLRQLAGNLNCPVLVVHGDRDAITPPRDRLSSPKITRTASPTHMSRPSAATSTK